MLTIHYFASIREALNKQQEHLELPDSVRSVADLIAYLTQLNPRFQSVFSQGNKILVAVNQTVVGVEFYLSGDDEVAFFPPMTGG